MTGEGVESGPAVAGLAASGPPIARFPIAQSPTTELAPAPSPPVEAASAEAAAAQPPAIDSAAAEPSITGSAPTTPAPGGAATPARPDGLLRLRRLEVLVAGLLLAAVSVLLISLHVNAYRQLSPVDEMQHIDAVLKAPHVIRAGEPVGQQALAEEACRGLESPFTPPPCGLPSYNSGSFQERGLNTAYIHPPAYYAVTKFFAEGWRWLTHTEIVTAARLVGILWLAPALALLYALARRLGAHWAPTLGALLMVAANPAIWFTHSVVSPDASSMLVAAVALYVAVVWERAWWRWIVLPLVGVAGVIFKLPNLIIVLVAATFLLLHGLVRQPAPPDPDAGPAGGSAPPARLAGLVAPLRQRMDRIAGGVRGFVGRPDPVAAEPGGGIGRRLVGASANAGLLLAGALVVAALVSYEINHRALVPIASLTRRQEFIAVLPVKQVVLQWMNFIPPIGAAHVAPFVGHGQFVTRLWAVHGELLLIGTVATAVARDRRLVCLSVATLIWMVLGGPLFALVNYHATHTFFAVSARYGYALLAVEAVLLAVSVRGRRLGYLLLAVGLFSVGYVAYLGVGGL